MYSIQKVDEDNRAAVNFHHVRRMKGAARVAGVLVISACVACSASSTHPGENDPGSPASAVDRNLRALADTAGFSGEVLIEREDGTVLSEAYGRPGHRPRKGAAYWVGSFSKQFTATAILRLRETGRLQLTDPLSQFFPGVPDDKKGITVDQLLTHASGLPSRYAADGLTSRQSAADEILREPLVHPPGGGFTYSNENYNLLAAIIEISSGQSFDDFLTHELFSRAGLEHTGLWGASSAERALLAPIPDSEPVLRQPGTIYADGLSVGNWGYRGATGVYSTVADMCRWVRAIRAGRVLSDSSLSILFEPRELARSDSISTVSYAYGNWIVERRGDQIVELRANGYDDWVQHSSFLRYLSNGTCIAVLSNAGARDDVFWSAIAITEVGRVFRQEIP